MRWVPLLVFVASCYAPASYSNCGVTCATDVDCPTGLSCFANRCSAEPGQCAVDAMPAVDAPDGSADVDTDGDGFVDAVDKCPAINSQDNRDHDGDGLGDICDPCPMFTNNTNSDTDKIGDLCDPRPANGADVATFFGFYDPAEYTTWGKSGNWSVTGGKLVASNLMLGGAVFFESPTTYGGNVAVYASIEILQISADAQFDRFAGVSGRRTGVPYEGCQFGIAPSPQNTNFRVRKVVTGGGASDNYSPYNGMLTVGSHPMRFFALDTITNCSVENETVAGGGAAVIGKVGVDVILMNAAVDYLFVVTMN